MDDLKRAPCVVSVSEHAGWAHIVCVAAVGETPSVVERRRVVLIEPGLPTQPYHHESLSLREEDANALIARVRRSIAVHAASALERLVAELAPVHTVVALAIRKPPFDDLPRTVADAWKLHRLLYAADGMMYTLALCEAARRLELPVHQCRRGEEASLAAERLGVAARDIEAFVTGSGRPARPPWAEEHRRAFAAGIAVLQAHTRGRSRMRVPTGSRRGVR